MFHLLEALETEVRGRSEYEPPPEVRALLRQVIDDGMGEQRQAVFEMLHKEPGWLAWFAEQIKMHREK